MFRISREATCQPAAPSARMAWLGALYLDLNAGLTLERSKAGANVGFPPIADTLGRTELRGLRCENGLQFESYRSVALPHRDSSVSRRAANARRNRPQPPIRPVLCARRPRLPQPPFRWLAR